MHSTKSEILALLKRLDGSTVDDLASRLQLAPMTVRQHLTALERDALVRAEEVRRATGRPHFLYRLTDDGHRRTLDGHDRLLVLLVEQAGLVEPQDVAEATPAERRARLFRRAAAALADRHRHELLLTDGVERLERVTAILSSHGGFAEWHQIDGWYEIRDFGCVYRATAGGHDDGRCAWHETFLSELLGTEINAVESPSDCAECCRYVIRAGVGADSRSAPVN